MTEEDYQDTIISLKRKLHSAQGQIDGYRHHLFEERGARRRDAEDASRWLQDIVDVMRGCDEYKSGRPKNHRELITERVERVVARLRKIPSTGEGN